MRQWGADWIYGIVAVMLFGAVILQVMPEGTYQKYARLFVGVILMLTVVSPLFSLLGLSENTRLSYEQGMVSSWLGGFLAQEKWQVSEEWEKTMQQQIRQKQEAWLQEPLEAMTEEYGFSCLRYAVEWNEAGDWPCKLTLWVTEQENTDESVIEAKKTTVSQERGSSVSSVEPVRPVGEDPGDGVKAAEKDSAKEDAEDETEGAAYYEPSELRQLHRALQTVWQLAEEQIVLYWER